MEIRQFLENEHKRLTSQLLFHLVPSSDEEPVPSPINKILEAASQFTELEQRTAKVRRVREQLTEIERALVKVAKGTYGICDDCEKLIAVERLKILPQTNLCLECKAKQNHSLSRSYYR